MTLHHVMTAHAGAARPAVLLLHGLGSSSADWAPQVSALAPRYRVLAVDLPGHGRSPRPPGAPRIERMAADVAALLDDLVEAPVHVVGLSLGGCVGLALALGWPARVRSLALVNTFARLAPAGPRGVGRLLVRVGLLAVAPMSLVAAHVARGLFPGTAEAELRSAAVASLSRTGRREYVAAMRALARFDVRSQLARVGCPTLVVAGERDATVPLAAKRRLATAIPGARLEIIAGSGHATPLDRPDALNGLLLEFLAAS